MNIVLRQSALICAALLHFAAQAPAKRIPPNPVSPVVFNGIQYTDDGDGRDEYVVATDASSGKTLWRVKVFHNRINFWIAGDDQLIYIANLKIVNGSLLIKDEQSRCYSVDLGKRRVRKLTCP